MPLSALMALWASGKGMQAITNGLNTIYHVKETRNWLMTRIYSVFYMLLFVLAIIVTLLVLVLGNRIQVAAQRTIPILGRLLAKVIGARTLLVFAVLFAVFLVLYKVLPNRKATFKSQLPGAFMIAVAWMIFSYGFSLYFEFFPNFGNMYGSLTALIMVMLWLYVCMNLLLYRAEINAYFENEFRKAQRSVKTLLSKKENEKQFQRILTLRLTEGRPCGIVLKDRKAVKVFIEDHFSQRREVTGCKLPGFRWFLNFHRSFLSEVTVGDDVSCALSRQEVPVIFHGKLGGTADIPSLL